MQKLSYKDFSFSDCTLDGVLNTQDDSDYGYWLICDSLMNVKLELPTSNYYLIEEK